MHGLQSETLHRRRRHHHRHHHHHRPNDASASSHDPRGPLSDPRKRRRRHRGSIAGGGDGASIVVERAAGLPLWDDVLREGGTQRCAAWIRGTLAADVDGSGGLSSVEFRDFLLGIDDPPGVGAYLATHPSDSPSPLPWTLGVVHKGLACRCEHLGMGEGCCEGRGAEMPLAWLEGGGGGEALTVSQQKVAADYRTDVCNTLAAVFWEVLDVAEPTAALAETATPSTAEPTSATPSTAAPSMAKPTTVAPATAPPTSISPTPPARGRMYLDVVGSVLDRSSDSEGGVIPGYLNVSEISATEGGERVLRGVAAALGSLSRELTGGLHARAVAAEGVRKKGRNARPSDDEELRLDSVDWGKSMDVTDIACPAGLMYAPEGADCLNFRFEVELLDAQHRAAVDAFIDGLGKAIDDEGRLYDAVVGEAHSDAPVVVAGLGVPGSGIDYLALAARPGPRSTELGGLAAEEAEEDVGGLGNLAIAFVALAAVVLPVAAAALYVRRALFLRGEARQLHLSKHEARGGSDDETSGDLESLEAVPPSIRILNGHDLGLHTIEEVMEERDDDTSDYFDASERSERSDASDMTLTHGDHFACDGSTQNVLPGSALTSASTLGAASAWPRSESVGTRARSDVNPTKINDDGMAEMKAKIRSLVEETNAPKSANYLLAIFAGKEHLLLSHLMTYKERQADSVAEVADAVAPGGFSAAMALAPVATDAVAAPSSTEQAANNPTTYVTTVHDKDAIHAEVACLVRNLFSMWDGGGDAGEVLDEGADELMAVYEGREDMLLSRLRKMEEKQAKDGDDGKLSCLMADKKSQADSTDVSAEDWVADSADPAALSSAAAATLVATANGAASALKEYAAINHTTNMATVDDKDAIHAEVASLVQSLFSTWDQRGYAGEVLDEGADELMAVYKDREDVLLSRLRKMEEKQAEEAGHTEVVCLLQKPSSMPDGSRVGGEVVGGRVDELMAVCKGGGGVLNSRLWKMEERQVSSTIEPPTSVALSMTPAA